MSMRKTYSINCPNCSHEQKVELYDSIHVAQEPELKTALLENRLNRVRCEDCDFEFRVDKPLLYHDADRNIIIHWMPESCATRDEIIDEFDSSLAELNSSMPDGVEPPRVRLVLTRVELVELIYILEAGMEQRVIEHIKYTVHSQNLKKLPPEGKELLLNVQDSTTDELLFAVRNLESGALEDVLRYPKKSYRAVKEMYKDNQEEFFELFPGPYISARMALLDEVAPAKED